MAKTLGRLKDRFLSKMRRCNRVCKNKDGLREPIFSNTNSQRHSGQETPEMRTVSCTSWLRSESRGTNNNTKNPHIDQDLFTEITEIDDFQENGRDEISGVEEPSGTKPPILERRRSSAFQRLKNWVKPEHRRDAICEQMEREIETRGVSLRQYRKFLATTYILYDLKML